MSVCAACNALFSGGDGSCPRCNQPLAAPQEYDAPVVDSAADHVAEKTSLMHAVIVGAALVPLSSFFGVQAWTFGIWWIWKPSIAADLLFTLGTVGAHVGAVAIGQRISHQLAGLAAAFASAWLLHWIVYSLSWNVVLGVAEGEAFDLPGSMDFVAQVGYYGLTVAALVAVGSCLYKSR